MHVWYENVYWCILFSTFLNAELSYFFWDEFFFCSTAYSGDYKFEISFETQSKETKSTTWTVRLVNH